MVATMDFHLRRRQKRRLKFFARYQMATTETRPPYYRKGKRIIARGCDIDRNELFHLIYS